MTSHVSTQRRRELVALRNITLNGEPAVIAGSQLDFPRIHTLRGCCSAEYAWATVDHIVKNRDGRFLA